MLNSVRYFNQTNLILRAANGTVVQSNVLQVIYFFLFKTFKQFKPIFFLFMTGIC